MSDPKWGESFLKTGLPLEHLVLTKFRSLGCICSTHIQYTRLNRDQQEAWFEFDLEATYPQRNQDTWLSFLVECKYHDQNRFWFFLPQIESDQFASDAHVLNCAPVQSLAQPDFSNLIKLSPCSLWGVVVSNDGIKQDNAVNTAIQQLVNGFVPYCLDKMFIPGSIDFQDVEHGVNVGDPYFPARATAVLPMIATNANIYRLKPTITDLELIRKATNPEDIADKVDWTWCLYEAPLSLVSQNDQHIADHKARYDERLGQFEPVLSQRYGFRHRPNWIVIANVSSLEETVLAIADSFLALSTKKAIEILGKKRRR